MNRYERRHDKFRADYSYEIFNENIIVIVDLDQGNRSVTNDMENVIADIKENLSCDLSGYAIIYKDSMNYWDGVKLTSNGSVDFYPLRETDLEKAVARLLHPLP